MKGTEPGVKPGRLRFCPEEIVAPPLNVARPETPRVEERVVAPVTPKVPPTEPLPVTEALFRVARPEVESVESVVLPVTPKVPVREELPATARLAESVAEPVTLRLFPMLRAPRTPSPPATVTAPVAALAEAVVLVV